MRRVATPVGTLRCTLGEGPRWRPEERALYLVDIAEHRLHRLDPATGEVRTRSFDQPAGCFAFRRAGGFVLAMRDGFALIDDFDAPLQPFGLQVEADKPWSRFNDGRTDALGRFWAGTRDGSKTHRDATLYRLDPDGRVTAMANEALTANGCAFSPDGRFLCVISELVPEIRVYSWRNGTLTLVEALSTVRDTALAATTRGAEIRVSGDGRFLYVSNRGEDAIVGYAVDRRSGRLREVQRIATGKVPWSFALHRSGLWAMVANQGSDSVALFRRDPLSGKLSATDQSVAVPKPTSVAFAAPF